MIPPPISIVVPTRDRLGALEVAVESILAQGPVGLSSLLVVDDGSSDGTSEYLAGLAAEGRIVHLAGPGRGAAAARNVGIRQARGEVIAFTDDDCEVPPGWAARLRDRLVETGAAAVGGRVVAAPDASRPAQLSQAITSGIARALNGDGSDAAFLTSNNVAYRADALRQAGLFDEGFAGAGGEERDLHRRLRERGGRLVYAPDIVVTHRPPLGWGGFVRQQVAYGRGARRYYGGRQRGRPGPRGMSPAQYLRSFVAAFGEVAPSERLVLALGLPLSQAAVAWGYLGGRSRP